MFEKTVGIFFKKENKMNILNINWEPGFGSVFTWFAMDKNGKIAIMINNGFGNLPDVLLITEKIDDILNDLNEYMWEESFKYHEHPPNKNGSAELDMYSSYVYRHVMSRKEVEEYVANDLIESGNYSDTNLPANKGFYIYQAIEGSSPGQDHPVGYNGKTNIGDYFRYLMPTIYASIQDIPKELRHGVAVSDSVDFMDDRIFDNSKVNEYFPGMYK